MHTNLSLWATALVLCSTAPLHLAAKECVAFAEPWIVHADGSTEQAQVSGGYDDPGTIVLNTGEAVSLHFYSNSVTECGQNGRFKVWKDGVLLFDQSLNIDCMVTLTEPGFYYPECVNDAQLFSSFTFPFNIALGEPPVVQLAPKVWLDGPYNADTGLMNDGLRAAGLVPLSMGYPVPTSTTAAVLAVTGPDAIVDWVLVVLQSSSDPRLRVGTRWGLLQRDGDIVGMDGVSPLVFTAYPGSYGVIVRHRNHLAVMTAEAIALDATPVVVDFRSTALATYGTEARRTVDGQCRLWAGSVGNDHRVAYTGVNNDRDPMLVKIGGTVPTATVSGYLAEDVNLDGMVKYTGSDNDRDKVLVTVGGTTPTAVRVEQLPWAVQW